MKLTILLPQAVQGCAVPAFARSLGKLLCWEYLIHVFCESITIDVIGKGNVYALNEHYSVMSLCIKVNGQYWILLC